MKVRELIDEHPLLLAGGALALGAIYAFARSRGKVSGAVAGALGAVALGVLRNVAVHKATDFARSWIDEHERQRADEVTSRNDAIEAFLEH